MKYFLGKYIRSRLLCTWILANIGGVFLANVVNLVALSASELLQLSLLFRVLLAFGVGAAVGFCQWLVLRRVVQNAYLWIILTAFGSATAVVFSMFVSVVVGGLLLPGYRRAYNFVVLLLFLSRALPVSLLQWLFLRDHVKKAWLWIVFSLLAQGWLPNLFSLDGLDVLSLLAQGWLLNLFSLNGLYAPMRDMSAIQVFLAIMLWGVFTGVITGIPIVKFADCAPAVTVEQD